MGHETSSLILHPEQANPFGVCCRRCGLGRLTVEQLGQRTGLRCLVHGIVETWCYRGETQNTLSP